MKYFSRFATLLAVVTSHGACGSGAKQHPDATPSVDSARAPDAPSAPSCLAGEYQGDPTWPVTFTVAPGSMLCAHPADAFVFDGNGSEAAAVERALSAALAAKGRITTVPGSYKIPNATTSKPFYLPTCLHRGEAFPVATSPAPNVEVERVEGGIGIDDGYYARADLGTAANPLAVQLSWPLNQTTLTLSTAPQASHLAPISMQAPVSMQPTGALYVSCALRPNKCWELKIGDAALQVDEYVWRASPGRGFASLTNVRGSVGGLSPTATDYASKTTVYGHHAFDRYHFVKLPSPQGNVCGVRIDIDVDEMWRVASADCSGKVIASLGTVRATSRACD